MGITHYSKCHLIGMSSAEYIARIMKIEKKEN